MSDENESASEKTHEATPRRLEKARLEGDIPRSQDAQTFAAYIGFGIVMLLASGWAAERMGGALKPFLDHPEDLAHEALERRHDLPWRGERHLDVDLCELRLSIGSKILITETPDDLEVPVHAGEHQYLLEDLR